MVEIVQTLTQLVITLGTLIVEIGALALRHALLIVWVAWWLGAVNWSKAWGGLARGGWMVVVLLTIVSALSVIITAAYYLWAIQRMMLGKLNPTYATLADVNWRERLTLYPLGALIIVFGFYPQAIFTLIEGSLRNLILPLQ